MYIEHFSVAVQHIIACYRLSSMLTLNILPSYSLLRNCQMATMKLPIKSTPDPEAGCPCPKHTSITT